MKIFLYNTLTRKKEEFKPIKDNKVGLYTCGPTVYDYAHIGNLRTYIFEDILRRTLEMDRFKVHQVMNITDIDDKTIFVSRGTVEEFKKLTKKYEKAFFSDLEKLNIKKAQTVTPATEYIKKMVDFISDLIDKGYAYKSEDGSIYYSIKKFKDYGKLSHLDQDKLKVGARVAQDEYSKENPADFALWKAWDKSDGEIFWDPSTWLGAGTKIGKGRPGWHIECSTMSQDKLGKTIDIHTGGVDNIFPHHENEIAQSEARTGTKFVKVWVHGEHLLVDGKKMAKSAHNFYQLADINKKGFSELAFRYLCLETHYRAKMNFTWESLEAAAKTLKNIQALSYRDEKKIDLILVEKIQEALNNDLDTPKAIALLHKANNYNLWLKFEPILGLGLKKETITVSTKVKDLIKARNKARANGDFKTADSIRKGLTSEGIKIEDTADGTKVLLE